jgi:3-oxoadipate enol-lactonase
MREISKGAVHLVYDDEGSGPAVLFSHCWYCDARQWPQAAAVARAGFRVLNLDNRGHGRSGPYRERHTLWDIGDDLIAVLDDAGEEQAVLVGLSIGGFAAVRAALRHPARVRALVLAATIGGLESRAALAQSRFFLPLIPTPVRPLLIPMLISMLFGPTARRTQPALIEAWRQRFVAQDARSMAAAFDAAIIHRDDVSSRLGQIGVPTLVVIGQEDPALAHASEMAGQIPGARLVVLPEAGHLSALESPQRFETALLEFLGGLPGPGELTRAEQVHEVATV